MNNAKRRDRKSKHTSFSTIILILVSLALGVACVGFLPGVDEKKVVEPSRENVKSLIQVDELTSAQRPLKASPVSTNKPVN